MILAELYHNLADSMIKAQVSSTLTSPHYGIVRTSQHKTGKHGIDEHGTGKHGTGKYETGKYGHLAILERVASVVK